MENQYIAAEDIDSGVECILIATIGDKPFIAANGEGRTGENVGTSAIAIPKGRVCQAIEGVLYLTEDTRIYRVPFSID